MAERKWVLAGVLFLAMAALAGLSMGAHAQAPLATMHSTPTSSEVGGYAPLTCGTFSLVSSPNPGVAINQLFAIAAVSGNDIWAVGSKRDSGNAEFALTEHWDGAAWSTIPNPGPNSSTTGLYGLEVLSSNDTWAVGYYSNSSHVWQTLIEHWNGTVWSVVSSPGPGSSYNYLTSVSAVSANDIWAVGAYAGFSGYSTLIEHWNGSSWSVVPSVNPGSFDNKLSGVAAVSSGNVWAVGQYSSAGAGSFQTLVERWNGTSWGVVSSPSHGSGNNYLIAVTLASSNDMWAVGYSVPSSGGFQTLTEHWDGSTWNIVPSPSPGPQYSQLRAVAVAASNDVWAAGVYDSGSTDATLVEHWDGSAWSIVPSENAMPPINQFYGVAVVSSDDVWAVGTAGNSLSGGQTLIERYNPCSGATPTPQATSTTEASPTSAPQPTATATFAPGQQYSDVLPDSPFYSYITCLSNRGIISGYADGTFRPGNTVTRGQLSKIVSRSANFADNPGPQIYQDVPPGAPFYDDIARLSLHGVISGYNCNPDPSSAEPCVPPQNLPYFRPNANATRGQISKIVVNTAVSVLGWILLTPGDNTFEDVAVGSPFFPYVETAVAHGVLGGYACGSPPAGDCVPPGNKPYFVPGNNATRGQTSKIVANAFFPNCQTVLSSKPKIQGSK